MIHRVFMLCAALLILLLQAAWGEQALLLPLGARQGALPPSLSAADLEASCDGRAVALPGLRPAPRPLSLAIVLQTGGSMQRHSAEIQSALRSLLGRRQPGDEFLTVNALSQPAPGAGFTSNVEALVSSVALPASHARCALFDSIAFALHRLEQAANPNRALLVIFAGDDVSSGTKPRDLASQVLASHVPVFVVSLYPRRPDDTNPAFFHLLRLAENSGGDIWDVFSFSKLPAVLSAVRLQPDYLLPLSPAADCGAQSPHKLKLHLRESPALQGVSLRYQHELPDPPEQPRANSRKP
jgi:hypothetical protein